MNYPIKIKSLVLRKAIPDISYDTRYSKCSWLVPGGVVIDSPKAGAVFAPQWMVESAVLDGDWKAVEVVATEAVEVFSQPGTPLPKPTKKRTAKK